MRRIPAMSAVLFGLVLVLGACGGDDDSADTSTGDSTETTADAGGTDTTAPDDGSTDETEPDDGEDGSGAAGGTFAFSTDSGVSDVSGDLSSCEIVNGVAVVTGESGGVTVTSDELGNVLLTEGDVDTFTGSGSTEGDAGGFTIFGYGASETGGEDFELTGAC